MGASSNDVTTTKRRGEGKQPEWATMVMEQFAAYHHRSDLPVLKWRYSKASHHSSGNTQWSYFEGTRRIDASTCEVVVTQGKCRMDALLVLVHELSHWIAGHNESHGARFWHIAWQSYKHFGLPLSYAFAREATYRKEAIHVGSQYITITADYYRRALSGDIARSPIYRSAPTNSPSVLGWEAIIGFVQPDTKSEKYISRNAPLPPLSSVVAVQLPTRTTNDTNDARYWHERGMIAPNEAPIRVTHLNRSGTEEDL